MRLDLFLAELLYDHDCVIIPGFGGLVANYRPARLNEKLHTIAPPAKYIAFNRNLVTGDGLLANHVALQLGLGYAEAADMLNQTVTEYREALNRGSRIQWDKIGFVFKDRAGNLQFIPDEQENFLRESFGLSVVQLTPVVQHQSRPVEVVSQSPQATKRISPWMAAAAVGVPLLLATAWLASLQWKNNPDFALASFNPFAKEVLSNYYPVLPPDPATTPEPAEEKSVELEDLLIEAKGTVIYSFSRDRADERGIRISVADEVPADTEVHTAKPSEKMERFSVIAGAFMYRENADKLVGQLSARGFNASIVGQSRGLHLVSCGNYETHSLASNAARNLRENDQIKAWVRKNY